MENHEKSRIRIGLDGFVEIRAVLEKRTDILGKWPDEDMGKMKFDYKTMTSKVKEWKEEVLD